jgi:hypothetical protein
MQIHELNKHLSEATSVTGFDTSKVSDHVAAQIKKAEADSQAKLAQQAQQAQQAAAPVQAEPDQQKQLKPTLAQRAKGLISTRQQVINKAMTDRDPNGAVQQRARAQLAQLQKEIPADMLNNPASQSNRSNNYIDKLVRLGDRQTVIKPTGNTDVDNVLKQLGFLI